MRKGRVYLSTSDTLKEEDSHQGMVLTVQNRSYLLGVIGLEEGEDRLLATLIKNINPSPVR